MSASLLVSNFRDVGESINVLAGTALLREQILYRGGELGLVDEVGSIGGSATIINLRKATDPAFEGAENWHFPAPNSQDVYLAGAGSNRKWIVMILRALGSSDAQLPIFVHCAAGKDRTGVVVAAILSCIGIPGELITEEYLLSAGPLYPDLFTKTLEAFATDDYFRSIDREAVARHFLR